MAYFDYTARTAGGEQISGNAEGASAAAIAERLSGSGITPVVIREVRAPREDSSVFSGLFAPVIQQVDVMLFSRQLYALLKAGVPILRALVGLRDSSTNALMRTVLSAIRESLESGRSLSAALALHPQVFSPFYLAMVRVGEMTGRMEEIFLRLFYHLEFEKSIREQVRTALRYPMFVTIVMAASIVIINIFVIPPFAKVYRGFNAKLPWMTEMLISFSEFMMENGLILLALLIVAVMGARNWVNTPEGRYRWDRMTLRMPIAGSIVHKAALARFARSFALAAKSGVPVLDAMSVVKTTVDNTYMVERLDMMRSSVERGESLLRSAMNTGVFTPVVLQMIAVGEESGAIDDLMEEVADLYQRDVEYELKSLGARIEPILIVFLGVLVLILALGVFLPIWDLGQAALKT